jgi:NAD(P)-dependent dehydrogenase (short-subunit alcohol dehydrogenase family)
MSNSSTPRTWLITGASSGIGLALARAAAERGENVTAIARRVDALAPLVDEFAGLVRAEAVDVTDQSALERAVEATVDAFGRIDVVVNSAGYGVSGAVEEAGADQVRAIFETNVLGVVNVLRAALPTLRGQRSGHVVQISSFLGLTSGPGSGLISATKYAVEGLSEALAAEIGPLGIDVTIVEPGLTATSFFSNLQVAEPIEDYEPVIGEARKAIAALPPAAFNTPERVAGAILDAVDAEHPPRRLPTGSFALGQMRSALHARLAELDAVAHSSAAVDAAVGAAV